EHCGIVESYKPKYMPHYNINNLYISNGKESCFNTELWLQKVCKGNNVFWATNFKHLEYLKQYIQADIRERNDFQRNMTMIAKLPKFIKSAKNRESLLKIIKQLEDK
nr:hypothetical protein [Flavobacteriaceae bacterium]